MKRNNDQSLKDVLNAMVKAYGMEDKLAEQRVKTAYQKCMGPFIVNKTTRLSYEKKILTISVNSSVLRSEMALSKSKIIEKLNAEIGDELITEIKLF